MNSPIYCLSMRVGRGVSPSRRATAHRGGFALPVARHFLWKVSIVAVLATSIGWVNSAFAASADWNIVDHIPLNRVVIQAHRGAGFLAEENTLAAFELGWSLGCYAEADIRTTTDGVSVAFHD